MTTYTYQSKGNKYVGPKGEKMPEHISVTASKLEIGSIVFLHTSGGYESATVSGVVVDPKHKWQRNVTTVTQSGKVDVHRTSASDRRFNLQCSKEDAAAKMERDMHITIRRRLQSLKDDIQTGSNELQRRMTIDRPTNPKLKEYVERFAQFAVEVQAMYDEVGRDLDIGQPKTNVTKGVT